MDPLSLLMQVAFYTLFAISLWRWARRRGPLELAVALVFAPLTALFTLSLLNAFAPTFTATVRPLLILILFLQPWFVVRLVDQIRPVARRIPLIVLLGGVVAAAAISALPGVGLVALAAVTFFFVVQVAAAVRLARDSRRRIGVARVRLMVAAIATALFGIALLVSGAASAANGGASVAAAVVTARAVILVAGVGYLWAFVPPDWLRRLAYRAMAFDLVRNLVSPEPGLEVGRLWADLASTARELLGARQVTILSAVDGLPLATAGAPRDATQPSNSAAEPPHGWRAALALALASSPAIVSKVEVPMRTGSPNRPARAGEHLVAEVEGRQLFVEDDVALLKMLGNLTARAVDREEALITLGQARHAIEESAAIKASESRFRALLEADPNAVLAMDEHQAVVWATRQAGELFGAKAQDLIGRPLADLVATPHDPRPSAGV
ncbi:MAG TPA: PAS domain-containing protein, partial [Candidatus Limnocylindrales bacterium]